MPGDEVGDLVAAAGDVGAVALSQARLVGTGGGVVERLVGLQRGLRAVAGQVRQDVAEAVEVGARRRGAVAAIIVERIGIVVGDGAELGEEIPLRRPGRAVLGGDPDDAVRRLDAVQRGRGRPLHDLDVSRCRRARYR